jgi:molecular chaperone DnaK
MPEYNVGIDLGTTYSCIAYIDDLGNAKVVKNFEEEETTPSVILFMEDGKIVGSSAKEQALLYPPDNSVSTIKREIGTDHKREILGEVYNPTELSSFIVKKLLDDFSEKMGTVVKKAVITVPAYFGDLEREATRQAGEIAGLEEVRIISEPTAAAVSYGVDQEGAKKNVLVYDLGGGTFDITLLKIEEKALTPICTEGDKMLGGKDWDIELANLIKQKIEEGSSISSDEIDADDQARNQIMFDAEKHKKTLSRSEQAKGAISIGANRVTYTVTKEEFENATAHLLAKTLDIMDKAMATSKLSISDIEDILLVGGSSRMPQVKAAIEAKYPGSKISLYDPDFAVAKGAAHYAMSGAFDTIVIDDPGTGSKGGSERRIGGGTGSAGRTIHHILGKTFGVEAYDENDKPHISNIIYRNKVLPIRNTESFKPRYDNQDSVLVKIYENDCLDGERETFLEAGTIVGEFMIDLPKGIRVTDTINITCIATEDGILTAILDCKDVHKEYTLDRPVTMSEKDMEQAKEKLKGLVRG